MAELVGRQAGRRAAFAGPAARAGRCRGAQRQRDLQRMLALVSTSHRPVLPPVACRGDAAPNRSTLGTRLNASLRPQSCDVAGALREPLISTPSDDTYE